MLDYIVMIRLWEKIRTREIFCVQDQITLSSIMRSKNTSRSTLESMGCGIQGAILSCGSNLSLWTFNFWGTVEIIPNFVDDKTMHFSCAFRLLSVTKIFISDDRDILDIQAYCMFEDVEIIFLLTTTANCRESQIIT